jgi:hypothetical protein
LSPLVKTSKPPVCKICGSKKRRKTDRRKTKGWNWCCFNCKNAGMRVWFRKRYANDPEFRERKLVRSRKWLMEKWWADPEWRIRCLCRNLQWHKDHPESDKIRCAKRKEKRANDPEYREQVRAKEKAYNQSERGQVVRWTWRHNEMRECLV